MRVPVLVTLGAVVSCVGTKEFTIHTSPEGAQICINGEPKPGVTPMTLEISQEKDLGIVATKPGYESAACTVPTETSWWHALLWTKSDPRAQYIPEDEVTIPMRKIPSAEMYKPTPLPEYTGRGAVAPAAEVPKLRELPQEVMR